MCTSVLCEAVELLCELHSPAKYHLKWFWIQRQDRMELKGDQWVKLRDQVLWQIPGDFLLKPLRVFVFSQHSGTFAIDIYRTVVLFFGHCYDSHSWIRKAESWNSSTSEMHQSTGNWRQYTSTASCKQNSFPHGFNLKMMSTHWSLPRRTPVLMQEACLNEATVKTLAFFPWHIFICYLRCYRN